MNLFKSNRVAIYSGSKKDKFSELKAIKEVANHRGCQKLCLDYVTENENVDAWVYDVKVNKTCTCLTFKACHDECLPNEITPIHNHKNSPEAGYWTGTVDNFVMLTRHLPCGKNESK